MHQRPFGAGEVVADTFEALGRFLCLCHERRLDVRMRRGGSGLRIVMPTTQEAPGELVHTTLDIGCKEQTSYNAARKWGGQDGPQALVGGEQSRGSMRSERTRRMLIAVDLAREVVDRGG